MGLGKTMQVIGFVDILLRYTSSRYVLCVVPVNTLQNWLGEFDKWLPPADQISSPGSLDVTVARKFEVFYLSESTKTMKARVKVKLRSMRCLG